MFSSQFALGVQVDLVLRLFSCLDAQFRYKPFADGHPERAQGFEITAAGFLCAR